MAILCAMAQAPRAQEEVLIDCSGGDIGVIPETVQVAPGNTVTWSADISCLFVFCIFPPSQYEIYVPAGPFGDAWSSGLASIGFGEVTSPPAVSFSGVVEYSIHFFDLVEPVCSQNAYLEVTSSTSNSVTVDSKCVTADATGVTVGIRISNDVDLQQIVVPLEIREITLGSFVTSLSMSYGERLLGFMTEVSVTNQHADRDGICGSGNPGYNLITYSDGAKHPLGSSPEGVMFGRQRIVSPPLASGADVTGSMVLTLDMTGVAGSFEIDTACTTPNNHLWFIEDGTGNVIVPTFTKGIIYINPGSDCSCPFQSDFDDDGFLTALDLGAMIDILYDGAPDVQDACCPVPRADFDCDGFSTALDLSGLIDHLFAGGDGPCDPCMP
jgi:hypothetical protein